MTWLVRTALLCSAACGSKPPAPAVHAAPLPAQSAQLQSGSAVQEDPGEPAPSHDPFEQPDDVPVDSKALLKEMRHDCCTELPATELEKHRQKD